MSFLSRTVGGYIFGDLHQVLDDRRFGLEIEVEGENLPDGGIRSWTTTLDGSLRGPENMEYVLREPMGMEGVTKALEYLNNAFERNNSEFHETIRAGVHVHINCRDISLLQMFNFVTVYYLFEEFLCNFCGPERSGNHFCLRVSDAYGPIQRLTYSLERGDITNLDTNDLRYAALNFKSLFRHGSLEFRAMRSTRDFDEILKWIKILNEIFQKSIEFKGNPRDIIEQFSGDGAEFISRSFLPTYCEELILSNPNYEKTMRSSMRNCLDYIYATTWRE